MALPGATNAPGTSKFISESQIQDSAVAPRSVGIEPPRSIEQPGKLIEEILIGILWNAKSHAGSAPSEQGDRVPLGFTR